MKKILYIQLLLLFFTGVSPCMAQGTPMEKYQSPLSTEDEVPLVQKEVPLNRDEVPSVHEDAADDVRGRISESEETLSTESELKMDPAISTEQQKTYADIENTLGLVPSFLRNYPPQSIAGAWEEFKSIQLSATTALTPKVKELLGLAVASQIPCSYCAEFHSEAAKFNGATAAEVKEAVAIAGLTRHWSTYLNGLQPDKATFRADVDKMVKYRPGETTGTEAGIAGDTATLRTEEIDTPEEALKDIEATLGFVPEFFSKFPGVGLPGAWKDFKTLELSNSTELEPKIKSLISLSVAAQVPCDYCVYFDTEAAKKHGASEDEIHEALAMAALTRKWSTVLNGLQTDPAAFSKEVEQIVSHLKGQKQIGETGTGRTVVR